MSEEREGGEGSAGEGAPPAQDDLRGAEGGLSDAALEALALDDDAEEEDVVGGGHGQNEGAGEGEDDGGDASSSLLVGGIVGSTSASSAVAHPQVRPRGGLALPQGGGLNTGSST